MIGVDYDSKPQLSPAALRTRQITFLQSIDEVLDRIPDSLHEKKIPGRDRTVWNLIEHMCEIARVYQSVAQGSSVFDATAADAEVTGNSTRMQIHSAIRDLTRALSSEDHDYDREIDTYFGLASLHYVLERCTWHIAQHLRQLASLTRSMDETIMAEINPRLLERLPIPIEVWD